MSITQEQVDKISKKLAKLHPNNSQRLTKDVNSILTYVDLLNQLDTSHVVPTVSVIEKNDNSLKPDIQKQTTVPQALLDCSAQKVIANQIAVVDIMK